jgi:hypothetical protein
MDMDDILDEIDKYDLWRQFQLEGYRSRKSDDGRWELVRYFIPRDDPGRLGYIRYEGVKRDPGWGPFIKLIEHLPDGTDQLWMSDTRAEINEHAKFLDMLQWQSPEDDIRVLINGLGLGMAVHAALFYDNITSVDVVEKDKSLVEFIGHEFNDPRLHIHVADAYDMSWDPMSHWDIVWHDIWPDIQADNLPGMHKLHHKYAKRSGWQDSWGKPECEKMRRELLELCSDIAKTKDGKDYLIGRASEALGFKVNLTDAIRWTTGQWEGRRQ